MVFIHRTCTPARLSSYLVLYVLCAGVKLTRLFGVEGGGAGQFSLVSYFVVLLIFSSQGSEPMLTLRDCSLALVTICFEFDWFVSKTRLQP